MKGRSPHTITGLFSTKTRQGELSLLSKAYGSLRPKLPGI